MTRDDTNLAWKAAQALWKAHGYAGEPRDTVVSLDKRIPMQAPAAMSHMYIVMPLGGGGFTRLFSTTEAYFPRGLIPELPLQLGGGVSVQPYGITKVTTASGELLYQRPAERGSTLVDHWVAAGITDLLQTAVNTGTGRAAQIGRPVAGKTGTTSSNKDGWFIGFSSGITTGVWMGRDDNRALPGLAGGRAPARAFHDYMMRAVANRPAEALVTEAAAPDGERGQIFVCSDHGQVTPMGNLVYIGNDHGVASGFIVQECQDPAELEGRVGRSTGDGAAVAFLADPEHALYFAMRLRRDVDEGVARGLHRDDLRIGINLGPVRKAIDVNGRPNLVGEGMNSAERIMSFSSPGDAIKRSTSSRLIAFGIALIVQMLYLAIRFKWTIGASAVAAMFHDVVIVVGIFAWLNKPIDGIFLAAALTIIGLSVNDTVVVFDRIREQWRATRSLDMPAVANRACLDTMPRTVNTGLGAMFILATLAVLGGDSLQDFSVALLLGLAIGTYSSVFTATPLTLLFHERWPLPKAEPVKKRAARDPEDSGAVI